MIPVHHGNVVHLVPAHTRVADLVGPGQRLRWRHTARRTATDKPLTTQQAANARREAEYVARRNGAKPALVQLWRLT